MAVCGFVGSKEAANELFISEIGEQRPCKESEHC